MNRTWIMALALSAAQASPQLCWFEPMPGGRWSARTASHRMQIGARGMQLTKGLELRFVGAANRAAAPGETIGVTQIGWQRSDCHTLRARRERAGA